MLEQPTSNYVGPTYPQMELLNDRLTAACSGVKRLPFVQVRQGLDPGDSATPNFTIINSHKSRGLSRAINYLSLTCTGITVCPCFVIWGAFSEACEHSFLYHQKDYWHADCRRPQLPSMASADLTVQYLSCVQRVHLLLFSVTFFFPLLILFNKLVKEFSRT